MTHRRKRLLTLVQAVLAIFACVVGWCAYTEYRKAQFLSDLHLVGFSTSLIGSPRAEKERAAHQRAEELGIDLLAAYEDNRETGARFHLAWMLISKESPEYYQMAKQNVDSVPWPEVRIWRVRRNEESLSSDYRAKLHNLLLASPTSEAKLAVARWYRDQGKIRESEDAYYAAMTTGLYHDALDAAHALLESERYRDDALNHLLSLLRDSEFFAMGAAFILLDLYDAREEWRPVVDSCRGESRDGPNRRLLVGKLTQLAENDGGGSRPIRNAP